MGYARWNTGAFEDFTRTPPPPAEAPRTSSPRMGHAPNSIPARFATRESRDSAINPVSTPVALFSDVTGSMGVVAESMIRSGLDTVMREIDRRRRVSDPHILVGAVGDAFSDRMPIQMTQFEAAVVLAEQLGRLWIEGGGGGNNGESYLAAHFAAGMKTSLDSFERRGRKGILFTMGDEPNHPALTRGQIERVFGMPAERDLSAAECLTIAQRSWEVFHIVFTKVGYAAHDRRQVLRSWQPLLGERVLLLDDHNRVAELVVSTLQLMAGESMHDIVGSWSGSTAVSVANALDGLAGSGPRRRYGFF